jgi:hypothetical protein
LPKLSGERQSGVSVRLGFMASLPQQLSLSLRR